jgi:hypothetical protein
MGTCTCRRAIRHQTSRRPATSPTLRRQTAWPRRRPTACSSLTLSASRRLCVIVCDCVCVRAYVCMAALRSCSLSSIPQLSSLPLSSFTPQRGESAVHPRLPTARGSGHAQPNRHCPVRRDLGVRVCAFSSCPCSPLSHAAHWPCRTLLQSSCDVNATNSAGQTPLHLACMLGADPTIVSMLIRAGCSLDTTDCEVCVCVCVCV